MNGPLQRQSALIVIGEGSSRAAAAAEARISSCCCLQVFCSSRSIKFPTKQLVSFRVVRRDLCAAFIVTEARGLTVDIV